MRHKNTGKRKQEMMNLQRDLDTSNEKNMCDCIHTKKGDPDLAPSRDQKNHPYIFTCRMCHKQVNIKNIDEDELRHALDVVDHACDIIKMHVQLDRAKDEQIADRISETQFRIRNQVLKLYQAAMDNKRKQQQRRGENDGNSGWRKTEEFRGR